MLRDGWMRDILARRREAGTFRELRTPEQDHCFVDFTSNDFLGLGRAADLRHAIEREAARVRQETAERRARARQGFCREGGGGGAAARSTASEGLGLPQQNSSSNSFPDAGSGGSRLLAGNSMYAEELERWIARFHRRQTALLFNSGYDANLGLISCLPQRGDAVVCDELVHNSVVMGSRLGRQQETLMFRHNDVEHLDATLRGLRAKGGGNAPTNIFVFVESVYSMDGDTAPLAGIFRVAGTHSALVIVDEAHSTGVFGEEGRGVVSALSLEAHPALLAAMHSFGKALGVHGAVVVGSATLKEFLVNYARPFIYSTSLPLHSLASIKCAYIMQAGADGSRRRLLELADMFQRALTDEDTTDGTTPLNAKDVPRHRSPIQAVLVAGNERSLFVADSLRGLGFDVRAIRKPTVQEGKELLRVTLHAFNTDQEVASLARQLRRLAGKNAGDITVEGALAARTAGKTLSTTATTPRSVDCVARARL